MPTAPCQTAVLGCSDFTDRSPTARYFRCFPAVDREGDRTLCFVSQVSHGKCYMNHVRYVNPYCTVSVIRFILVCVSLQFFSFRCHFLFYFSVHVSILGYITHSVEWALGVGYQVSVFAKLTKPSLITMWSFMCHFYKWSC